MTFKTASRLFLMPFSKSKTGSCLGIAKYIQNSSDDDDLIESIEEELGYETLLSEKGKIDLEKLFKEDTEKSNQN